MLFLNFAHMLLLGFNCAITSSSLMGLASTFWSSASKTSLASGSECPVRNALALTTLPPALVNAASAKASARFVSLLMRMGRL